MGEDGIKLFALEKSLASLTQHKFRDVRLARGFFRSYRKSEHSSKGSEFIVNRARCGPLILPPRYILCHAVTGDLDCFVGTEKYAQMIDGIFSSLQRFPGVCSIVVRKHGSQVLK